MKTPRTILFLHPSADMYGADRTLLQLIQGLDRDRWRAVIVLPKRGSLAKRLEQAGALVEIAELGLGERSSLRLRGIMKLAWTVPLGALNVLRLARRYRPSLIHTNTMVVLGGAIGARLSGAPHLWHVHEILENPTWLARAYAKVLCTLATRVVSNSEATRHSFDRWCSALAGKHDVVLNGMDPTRKVSTEERLALRAELGISENETLVLLAGRINSWKGQGLLLDAAAKLQGRFPAARFLLAGSAPVGQEHFEEAVVKRIAAEGLKGTVQRIPFHSNPALLFEAADISCVPSTRPEPFGLVAIEAMAAGKPVVASNHGGLVEVVEDGVTGLLFEPGDAASLEDCLAQLLGNREMAQAMGQAGRERQQQCFAVERYIAEFNTHYDQLALDRRPMALPVDTRVIHLALGKVNPDRLNGVNRAVHSLASAQVAAGRQVEVWGLTPTPEDPAGDRPYSLRLFRFSSLRGLLPADLRAAIAALEGPTVVHLHGGLLPEMASAARHLERAGIPMVFTPHGAYNPRALAKRPKLKRLCMAFVDSAILRRARSVQAFTTAESHATARWVALERIAVVPNGQTLSSARRNVPTPVGRGTMRFGFCGRLDAHTKGLDLLLDGFAQFLAQGGRGTLTLIGDGPDRKQLEQRASLPELEGQVEFTGALFNEAKNQRMTELDAFVHPSRHEGMPMAVLEAAAMGLPLLVSEGTQLASVVQACGAGPELGSTGVEGIAEALSVLAGAGTEELEAWGSGARSMVDDLFSWEKVEPLAGCTLYGISEAPERQQSCEPREATVSSLL